MNYPYSIRNWSQFWYSLLYKAGLGLVDRHVKAWWTIASRFGGQTRQGLTRDHT